MSGIFSRIPVLRSLIRIYLKNKFKKNWRKLNQHNDTVAGDRFFSFDKVKVGKSSYGVLLIQTMNLDAGATVEIGNYVSIAPGVQFLLDVNHQMDTITTFPFYSRLIESNVKDAYGKGKTIVEDEVWIGTNAIIMPGVHIAKGAIIAAGSVVTKAVPAYSIYGGNPARLIRLRFEQNVIDELMKVDFTKYSDTRMREHIEMIYSKISNPEDVFRIIKLLESK